MCGICGIAGDRRRERIFPMVRAMHHRGPDDFGIFMDNDVSLAMTRLAILDLSPAGHQPMYNADKSLCIVYNGELYNFRSERTILEQKGHRFHSQSDTEVVLHMYEEYGDDFLTRMRGMFALAIYDKRSGHGREKLFLARDQFGIKPLLYSQSGARLIFASEMKAMLASGLVTRAINEAALPLLLVKGSIPQPLTAVAGVEMLLPGHRLIHEEGRSRIERYWHLQTDRHADLLTAPWPELVERVQAALEETVRRQMVSDVPVGAFLSGGIDSSLMVALMSRQSSHKVKTFSVGFGAEGATMDETDDAGRIAAHLGTDHRRIEITGAEVRDRMLHMASALDQPTVDGVNSYFVSLAAKSEVTVAISGTGGDELFAGYPWFLNMYRQAAAGVDDFPLHYAHQHLIFQINAGLETLAPPLQSRLNSKDFLHEFAYRPDELPEAAPIERVSALCLRGYLQNQLLRDIDAASMAHSLEVRVPFLDTPLTDIALSLPLPAKLHPDTTSLDPYAATYRQTGVKRILIELGRGLLPPDMDDQPKRGFGMPFAAWMHGPLRDIVEDTLSVATVNRRGIFDLRVVPALREDFFNGRGSWPQPWLLMMTELWCRQVLDAPAGQ